MKTKRLVLIIAVLVLVFCALTLRQHFQQAPALQQNEAGNSPIQSDANSNSKAAAPTLGATTQSQAVVSRKTVEKTLQSLSNAILDKNVPINFWGKIVDQDENPVSDVKLTMSVRQWTSSPTDPVGSTQMKFETATDSDGRFQLVGTSGDAIDLETVEKEGYRLMPKTKTGFAYGDSPERFNPDPSAPVIIRMWKSGMPATLISNKTLFGFAPDGHPYTLNLLTNKKIEGTGQEGDLVIELKRPSKVLPHEKYLWNLKIMAVDGGVMMATDDFKYAAPDSGYQPEISIEMNPDDLNWAASLEKSIYIRSRNGAVFGVATLQVRSKYNSESAILVESRMNPTGSRNLEPKQ